jgi:hypothetical protein
MSEANPRGETPAVRMRVAALPTEGALKPR